jgi:hypothetical protein
MKNKEQKIVRLLEEGFSYETIKKMSDLHINKIYESLDEAQEYSSTTQVFNPDNESDRREFDKVANAGGEKQITATDKGEIAVTTSSGEVAEDDVDNIHPFKGRQTQVPKQVGPSTDDGDDNYQDGMDLFEDIDEDAVIEELFGNTKKKMKTPITTLGIFEGEVDEKFESKSQQRFFYAKCEEEGPKSEWCKMAKEFSDDTKDFDSLPEKVNEGTRCWKGYKKKGMKTMFGKRVPNCVKKESKEEKVRQIEESILSLINKSQGKMLTKKDILEQGPSIAPTKPTVKPGVRPERGNPYKPKHSPKPKAGTEVKPARPTVKPGVRPERGTPYKPKHSPKPKAGEEQGLPEFLKFNNLNIKFRDE